MFLNSPVLASRVTELHAIQISVLISFSGLIFAAIGSVRLFRGRDLWQVEQLVTFWPLLRSV
jgi:hypothetical protein